MKSMFVRGIALASMVIVAGLGTVQEARAVAVRASTETSPTSIESRPKSKTAKLPLLFVENRGQADGRAGYYLRGRGETVWFTNSGVVYALDRGDRGFAVAVDFVGARSDARPQGRDAAPTVMSWFRGPKDRWIAGVPTFHEVVYRDVWPGVDVVFTAGGDRLKYRFELRTGADPAAIRLACRGADDVRIDGAGRLTASTSFGDLVDDAPKSWQGDDDARADVATSYEIESKSPTRGVTYGFHVGAHDPALPLVIDPVVFVYAGYIGGDGGDQGIAIAVDGDGFAYVAGQTDSSAPTFPLNVGPYVTKSGGEDVFVGKLAADGTAFVYLGYLAGTGYDQPNAIAVDHLGAVYVLGTTGSNEKSAEGAFPVTVGPDLTFNGGNDDAFVAKVDAAGTSLAYCGYIGGGGDDGFEQIPGGGIAVDDQGAAYVTSTTTSSETEGFPVKVGPDLTYNDVGSWSDAFVAKVKVDGSGLDWCGYIGGAASDRARGIALDSTGHAYVVGDTASQQSSFPVKIGPDLTENGANGDYDGFIAKVSSDGSGLDWCGYIGGQDRDACYGVAVTPGGDPYVCGFARSDETTTSGSGGFPVKVGPKLTFGGSTADGFVARVKADGTGLVWCGYIGSDAFDLCTAVALAPDGRLIVAGETTGSGDLSSDNPPFPVKNGPDLVFHGGADAFVAEVNAAGTGLDYAGYIGGSGEDEGLGVAVDSGGNAYVTGLTAGGLTTSGGPDPTFNSSNALESDAFVAKVSAPTGGGGVTPIDSFLLPTRVSAKLNAKKPESSTLTMAGVFDLGSAAPSWSTASTLDVGALHFDISQFARLKNGKSYAYSAGGVTFTVVPSAGGSSKAAFSLKYAGDLTGKIPNDGQVVLKFVDDVATAQATFDLSAGSFKLATPHGKLIDPDIFIGKASAKLLGAGKDTLSLTLGIATDGTTPAVPDVTFSFGGFSRTIQAAQFKRKGSKDTFADKHGDITSVVVDYAKQTITIAGKGLTLDAFAQGANTIDVAAGLGAEVRAVRVQIAVKGTKASY